MDFGRADYNEYFSSLMNPNEVTKDCPFDEDEPVFIIRGHDPLAQVIMAEYVAKLMVTGSDIKIIDSIVQHSYKIKNWQKIHGTKHPDLMRSESSQVKDRARIQKILENLEVDERISSSVYQELTELMESCYGPNSLVTLMPEDLIAFPGGWRSRIEYPDAKVIIGITMTKSWIIIKREI